MFLWLKNIGIEVSKTLLIIYFKELFLNNHFILSIWTSVLVVDTPF